MMEICIMEKLDKGSIIQTVNSPTVEYNLVRPSPTQTIPETI